MKNKFKVGDKIIFGNVEGGYNCNCNYQWLGKTGTIIKVHHGSYMLKEYPDLKWAGDWFKPYNKWGAIVI